MTEKNQTAFPVNGQPPIYTLPDGTRRIDMGLTKREYFAAMAMQAIISTNSFNWDSTSRNAVQVADDLILELNNKKQRHEH